jgi:hypothetical protein
MSRITYILPRVARAAPVVAVLLAASIPATALAAQPQVGLGNAGPFALLAGSTATNTGPSTINGNLGVYPGGSAVGFTSATINGATHIADAAAGQAQAALTTAYDDAAGRTPALTVAGDLGGLTLTPGVYRSGSSLGLTGALTLDAQNNPAAVFIFQAGSSLTTASGSRVDLVNGAQPCNVFWQVGSSAVLGTTSVFAGSILALTSISMNDGVTVYGRALARNGAVTLINDTITPAGCSTDSTTTPGGSGPGATTPGTTTIPAVVIDGVTVVPAITLGPPPAGDTGSSSQNGAGGPGSPGNGTALFTTAPRNIAKTIAQFGVSRCVDTSFKAVVTGLFIRKVVFSQGKRVIATRRKAPWQALVGAGEGIHTITARVTFSDGTRAANLKMRFKACAEATRAAKPARPRKSPAFTG